jgi:hypothetical protein
VVDFAKTKPKVKQKPDAAPNGDGAQAPAPPKPDVPMVWCYDGVTNEWTRTQCPLKPGTLCGSDEQVYTAMRAQGWHEVGTLGHAYAAHVTLYEEGCGGRRYLLVFLMFEVFHEVLVNDFPSLLELLSKSAPLFTEARAED